MILLSVILFSCGSSKKSEESSGITLTKAPASPEFSDASLEFYKIMVRGDSGKHEVQFGFDVESYELGAQTEDAATRGIANSGKGQHIHLIVNNGPYSAHYEPEFSKEMDEGEYVVLAFLSRSYHESVKNSNSYFVDKIRVGEPTETLDADFSAKHLFYSRPKGTYSGADTEKLMLDFFLLNTTLSPNGDKVKANINGEEFIIDEWAPFYIEGLEKGEVTVKLELIDAEGNFIEGPFNRVERKVTLE
ncbi:MAG: hypothetical protein AAF363_18270 [Bacteroidota bacterium]